jgi:transcriptional regulator with XRE-family HTH domain
MVSETPDTDFAARLRQLIAEYGSRYALAKASGIAASTLQSYEAGSKPGIDALIALARIGNVDLNWLLRGAGPMRPAGLMPGAAWADFVVVDQYKIGAALSMSVVVGEVPFSRRFLEDRLRLAEPNHGTLLIVEADWSPFEIARGDLVLIDRNQKELDRDGVYLLDLPGIALRAVTRWIGGKVRVAGPVIDVGPVRGHETHRRPLARHELTSRRGLFGSGDIAPAKVVGRAVWVGRAI